jgi:hypothetical protein
MVTKREWKHEKGVDILHVWMPQTEMTEFARWVMHVPDMHVYMVTMPI